MEDAGGDELIAGNAVAGNDNANAGGNIVAGNVAGNDGQNLDAGLGAQIVAGNVAGNDGQNLDAGLGAQEIAVAGDVIDAGGVVIAVRRSARPIKATKRLIQEIGNEKKRKKRWPPVIAKARRTPRVPVVPGVDDMMAEGGAQEGGVGGGEEDVQDGSESDEAQE